MIRMYVLLMYGSEWHWRRRGERIGGGAQKQQNAADARSAQYVTRRIVGFGCRSSQPLFVGVTEQTKEMTWTQS